MHTQSRKHTPPPSSHSNRYVRAMLSPTSVLWLLLGRAFEWLARRGTSASGGRVIWVAFFSVHRAHRWVPSGNGGSRTRSAPSLLTWKEELTFLQLDDRVEPPQEDPLKCICTDSFQVIRHEMPISQWYAGDGGEKKITIWHRSSCIYDFLHAPLLSQHNQLHRGRNNWFSVYANAMDLERGQANTQPCCLSGMTFKMKWRVFDSGQIARCFCCCSNDRSGKSCQVALLQTRGGNQTFRCILPPLV